jgi:hypothetical protein
MNEMIHPRCFRCGDDVVVVTDEDGESYSEPCPCSPSNASDEVSAADELALAAEALLECMERHGAEPIECCYAMQDVVKDALDKYHRARL